MSQLFSVQDILPLQRSCRLEQAKQTQTHRAAHPNFSGEVVRCGASQKKPLRDSTHSTALSGLIFWDVPQIAAYREKLLVFLQSLPQLLWEITLDIALHR